MSRMGLALALCLVAAPSFAKEPTSKSDAQAQVAALMAKYATPGAQHKMLEKQFAGSWTVHTKMWMGPGKAVESDGTNECKVGLGGRIFEDTFKGAMMGQSFEGHGQMGYDLGSQKYFSVWIDSMSTWPVILWGSYDEASKTYHLSGDAFDPMQGKNVPTRYAIKIDSDSKHTFEIFGQMNGKEVKMLEMVYTRK